MLNPDYPWAVWYPLRRIGAFNRLPRAEQGKILMEHGMLGRRYGEAGYAVDVRLECHGLDRDDNEFVIGLIGPDLFPAVAARQGHAGDPPDGGVHSGDGPLLRRPSPVPERPCRPTAGRT